MSYDEMELDMIGDQRTAMFVIISDTDDTFNFVVAIMYTQLFNLLCDKADDEHGGRLPYHVRLLLDEFSNIGQIPKFDKLIATIRSREISASIILQSQSQLKTIYKDAAETITGNCDTVLFLGGKESSTLKEISETLGKENNFMSITKVGSSYNFIYNTKTGKLSTKDGSKNEFVDFCNGDVKGEDTETLNHFDEHTRYQFTRMLFAYGTGMTGQNPFANDEKVEITADIDSATHTSFYVNGQKAFTAITGMSYLPSEIQTFGTVQQPFKTRGYKPYDPSTNSITIGVGSRFNLGNGYSMTVQEDFVWGEGYGNGSKADDERCNMMIGGLNSLIHFADQQYFSSMTDTYTDYILDFLASQGVDTSREFVINGTHCELVNGKISEVGNDYVVPSSIQQKAVKRYEESMSQLLNSGTWYRWS